MKTTKGQKIGARSLIHNTLGVEGRARAPRWGLGQMTSGSIIHMDLHKPNNKLVMHSCNTLSAQTNYSKHKLTRLTTAWT